MFVRVYASTERLACGKLGRIMDHSSDEPLIECTIHIEFARGYEDGR